MFLKLHATQGMFSNIKEMQAELTAAVLIFGQLRQEDCHEFEDNLDYKIRAFLGSIAVDYSCNTPACKTLSGKRRRESSQLAR